MTDLQLGIGIGAAMVLLLVAGWYYWKTKGDFDRFGQSRRIADRWLADPAFAEKVGKILNPEPPKPVKPSGEPLRLLALLQREGRLLDFLLEDIDNYANEQIGVAVRDIHRSCRKTLNEHLVLAPVIDAQEDAAVDVPSGFDPSAIRLVGNVSGQPPFKGTLRHHGWRVRELKLAKPAETIDEFVVAPAEVELA